MNPVCQGGEAAGAVGSGRRTSGRWNLATRRCTNRPTITKRSTGSPGARARPISSPTVCIPLTGKSAIFDHTPHSDHLPEEVDHKPGPVRTRVAGPVCEMCAGCIRRQDRSRAHQTEDQPDSGACLCCASSGPECKPRRKNNTRCHTGNSIELANISPPVDSSILPMKGGSTLM